MDGEYKYEGKLDAVEMSFLLRRFKILWKGRVTTKEVVKMADTERESYRPSNSEKAAPARPALWTCSGRKWFGRGNSDGFNEWKRSKEKACEDRNI